MLALLSVAAIWGGSYFAAQQLAIAIGLAASLALRFIIAAPVLVALASITAPKRWWREHRLWRGGLLLGSLRAATIGLETAGVLQTSATNAGVLIGLSVILTPLLESVVNRQRPQTNVMASAAVATIGIALLTLGSGGAGFAALSTGDVLILCAAVTRAVLVLVGSKIDVSTHGSIPLTAIEVSFGALVFGLAGGVRLARQVVDLSPTNWLIALFLGLGCTVFAFALQLWATNRTSAAHASLLLGTEPVWALAVGVFLAGNQPGAVGYIGVFLIIPATYWSQRSVSQRAREHDLNDRAGQPMASTVE